MAKPANAEQGVSYDIVSLGFEPVELLSEFLRLYPSEDPANASYSLRQVDPEKSFCPCLPAQKESWPGQPRLDYQTSEGIRQLPAADHYVLFHVLATQPDKELARELLRQAVRRARKAVWLRTPSFERQAMGSIEAHNLRLAWTTWTVFRARFTMAELLSWLPPNSDVNVEYRAVNWIRSLDDEKVVPITAPPDTRMFDGSMGYKSSTILGSPIPSEYEIAITK